MASDKAQKQPKDKPKAQPTPPPVVAGQQIVRTTTDMRCPACNRLSEWDDTYLGINSGKRVICPNCGETMVLP